jgi:hypothetical protein
MKSISRKYMVFNLRYMYDNSVQRISHRLMMEIAVLTSKLSRLCSSPFYRVFEAKGYKIYINLYENINNPK